MTDEEEDDFLYEHLRGAICSLIVFLLQTLREAHCRLRMYNYTELISELLRSDPLEKIPLE